MFAIYIIIPLYHRLSYKFPSTCALLWLWNQCAQSLSLDKAPLSFKAEQNRQMRTIQLKLNKICHSGFLICFFDWNKSQEWFSWQLLSSLFGTNARNSYLWTRPPLSNIAEQNRQLHRFKVLQKILCTLYTIDSLILLKKIKNSDFPCALWSRFETLTFAHGTLILQSRENVHNDHLN